MSPLKTFSVSFLFFLAAALGWSHLSRGTAEALVRSEIDAIELDEETIAPVHVDLEEAPVVQPQTGPAEELLDDIVTVRMRNIHEYVTGRLAHSFDEDDLMLLHDLDLETKRCKQRSPTRITLEVSTFDGEDGPQTVRLKLLKIDDQWMLEHMRNVSRR